MFVDIGIPPLFKCLLVFTTRVVCFAMFPLVKIFITAIIVAATYYSVYRIVKSSKPSLNAQLYNQKVSSFVSQIIEQILAGRKETISYVNLDEILRQVSEDFITATPPTCKVVEQDHELFLHNLFQIIYKLVSNNNESNIINSDIKVVSKKIRLLMAYPKNISSLSEFQYHSYLLKRWAKDDGNFTEVMTKFEEAQNASTLAILEPTFIVASNQKLKRAIWTLGKIKSVSPQNTYNTFLSNHSIDALSIATVCHTGCRMIVNCFDGANIPYLSASVVSAIQKGLMYLNREQLIAFFKIIKRTRVALSEKGAEHQKTFYSSHHSFVQQAASFPFEIEQIMVDLFKLCYKEDVYQELQFAKESKIKEDFSKINTQRFPECKKYANYEVGKFLPLEKQPDVKNPFDEIPSAREPLPKDYK